MTVTMWHVPDFWRHLGSRFRISKLLNNYSHAYLYSWHRALWWGKTLGQLFEVDLRECIIEISVAPMGKPYDNYYNCRKL